MNREKFEYSYSAPTEAERREIESIRREYSESSTRTGLEELRKYDARARNPAKITAITLGVVGLLIFGLGMSMVLEWSLYLWGVLISALGIGTMLLAYPVYTLLLKRGKIKYGPKILELLEEIQKNDGK